MHLPIQMDSNKVQDIDISIHTLLMHTDALTHEIAAYHSRAEHLIRELNASIRATFLDAMNCLAEVSSVAIGYASDAQLLLPSPGPSTAKRIPSRIVSRTRSRDDDHHDSRPAIPARRSDSSTAASYRLLTAPLPHARLAELAFLNLVDHTYALTKSASGEVTSIMYLESRAQVCAEQAEVLLGVVAAAVLAAESEAEAQQKLMEVAEVNVDVVGRVAASGSMS